MLPGRCWQLWLHGAVGLPDHRHTHTHSGSWQGPAGGTSQPLDGTSTLGCLKPTQAECLLGILRVVQGQFCISRRGGSGTQVPLYGTLHPFLRAPQGLPRDFLQGLALCSPLCRLSQFCASQTTHSSAYFPQGPSRSFADDTQGKPPCAPRQLLS